MSNPPTPDGPPSNSSSYLSTLHPKFLSHPQSPKPTYNLHPTPLNPTSPPNISTIQPYSPIQTLDLSPRPQLNPKKLENIFCLKNFLTKDAKSKRKNMIKNSVLRNLQQSSGRDSRPGLTGKFMGRTEMRCTEVGFTGELMVILDDFLWADDKDGYLGFFENDVLYRLVKSLFAEREKLMKVLLRIDSFVEFARKFQNNFSHHENLECLPDQGFSTGIKDNFLAASYKRIISSLEKSYLYNNTGPDGDRRKSARGSKTERQKEIFKNYHSKLNSANPGNRNPNTQTPVDRSKCQSARPLSTGIKKAIGS